MSEKVIRICDVVGGGGHAVDDDVRATETFTYNIEGTPYSIDLCGEHIAPFKLFEQSMAAWAQWGTADREGPRAAGPPRKRQDTDPETQAVREWARANGHEVAVRGRVSPKLREMYRESQQLQPVTALSLAPPPSIRASHPATMGPISP